MWVCMGRSNSAELVWHSMAEQKNGHIKVNTNTNTQYKQSKYFRVNSESLMLIDYVNKASIRI